MEPAALQAYMHRIGFAGDCPPTLTTLERLVHLHSHAIAFENLSPLQRERVSLEPGALWDKLIAGGRGGYCFEHNLLMWSVLRQLGFPVSGLAARVHWNAPDPEARALGHMALRVEVDGAPFLVDVGFGGLTLTMPLRLDSAERQSTGLEPFRIAPDRQQARTVSALLGDAWTELYSFEATRYRPQDYEGWNFWTSTAPESHFVSHLMAARPAAQGRHALADNRYTFRPVNGLLQTRRLQSVEEIRGVLDAQFGIQVPVSPSLDAKLAELAQQTEKS